MAIVPTSGSLYLIESCILGARGNNKKTLNFYTVRHMLNTLRAFFLAAIIIF